MKEGQEMKSIEIERLLTEVIDLLGTVKYLDLEKSLKIVTQRNYKQYSVAKNKIEDVIMRIYNTRINNAKEVLFVLNKISNEIDQIILLNKNE